MATILSRFIRAGGWRNPVVLLAAAALLLVVGLLVSLDVNASVRPSRSLAKERIERGRYLVTIMVCNDCHTPWKEGPNGPEPDMSRMLSGHPETVKVPRPVDLPEGWIATIASTNTAFAGPWGISYAMNLTPDRNTGIGIWDEDLFIKTIRTGRHWGTSRPIMPPMPWPFFAKMTDEDLKAVYAYLRTIPPITNHVPDYEPPPAAATQ